MQNSEDSSKKTKSPDSIPLESPSFIQRHAIKLVAAVFVLALIAYFVRFLKFDGTDQEQWGQFGDFLGGLVNPIIGFITILLLSVSLRQNHQALNQANNALAQSKVELELTREAIGKAAEIQAKTEGALREQIETAQHARDMTNAVALFAALTERRILAVKKLDHLIEVDPGGEKRVQAQRDLDAFEAARSDMGTIMAKEVDRLRAIHLAEPTQN